MEVIKKINNNSAVCIDSAGNELVAIGTGIGFPKVPYTLDDLDKIQKTYYDVNPHYLEILNDIPEDIFFVSSKIVDLYRNRIKDAISSNLVFTLADHLYFAIEREKNNIVIENPLYYDVQHLYETEYTIGKEALKIIYKDLDIRMSKTEITNIALHLINARTVAKAAVKQQNCQEVVDEIVDLVGSYFHIYVDKNTMNYSRFVSHVQYLLKRGKDEGLLSSLNGSLFEEVVGEYPETYECVQAINRYLKEELDLDMTDEESLYMILHINRLCSREDCYRKGITPAKK